MTISNTEGYGEIYGLKREDSESNCHRFYRIRILPDFFAPASLQIAWGRIGKPERLRVAASGDFPELVDMAEQIAQGKLKKGYEQATP